MNIMDNMDSARFNSGNPHQEQKEQEEKNKKAVKKETEKIPMVLKDLNQK
jgi:hypothetical protein